MELIADPVIQKIEAARSLYYRLVLVVGPAGSGKTQLLQGVAALMSARIVNVNLELSRQMLYLTERQRSLRLMHLLGEIVAETGGDLVLLDNIEILFDTKLKQDPLRLLQTLSRNKTIVATWNGKISPQKPGVEAVAGSSAGYVPSSVLYLTYAVPEHPEYRRYPVRDFLVVTLDLPHGGRE